MDIASVFEWFAQESKSIAEQAAEREQREKFAELALLWDVRLGVALRVSRLLGGPSWTCAPLLVRGFFLRVSAQRATDGAAGR